MVSNIFKNQALNNLPYMNNLKEATDGNVSVNVASSVQSPIDSQSGKDSVNLSDEARKLAGESHDRKNAAESSLKMSVQQGGEQDSGNDPVKQLREQIETIQEKLREAQARLAAAQAKSGDTAPKPGEDPAEAAMKAAMETLAGSSEVEAIQMEIEMLMQQLLVLNDQLREAMGTGGQLGSSGTAGVGGAGSQGGLGERISVSA